MNAQGVASTTCMPVISVMNMLHCADRRARAAPLRPRRRPLRRLCWPRGAPPRARLCRHGDATPPTRARQNHRHRPHLVSSSRPPCSSVCPCLRRAKQTEPHVHTVSTVRTCAPVWRRILQTRSSAFLRCSLESIRNSAECWLHAGTHIGLGEEIRNRAFFHARDWIYPRSRCKR